MLLFVDAATWRGLQIYSDESNPAFKKHLAKSRKAYGELV
jgi:hypothetical protein